MCSKYCSLLAIIAVAMIMCFLVTGRVMAWDMWVSHQDPGSAEPPLWPWEPLPADLSLDWHEVIWIAVDNSHFPLSFKYWSITIDPHGNDLFWAEVYDWNGYYNPGPQTSATIYYGWRLVTPPGSFYYSYFFESIPAPDWEVVKIERTQKGSQQITVTITGSSLSCYREILPIGPCVDLDSLSYGAPYDTVRLTQVWVFNDSVPINPQALPTITAPPQSGTWEYELVQVDPGGNPRPIGGVRWYTAGPGIESGQLFSLGFCLIGTTQHNYSLYLYDAFHDRYEEFVIPVTTGPIPTLTEWGLIIFCALLFGWMVWVIVRRRKVVRVRV